MVFGLLFGSLVVHKVDSSVSSNKLPTITVSQIYQMKAGVSRILVFKREEFRIVKKNWNQVNSLNTPIASKTADYSKHRKFWSIQWLTVPFATLWLVCNFSTLWESINLNKNTMTGHYFEKSISCKLTKLTCENIRIIHLKLYCLTSPSRSVTPAFGRKWK